MKLIIPALIWMLCFSLNCLGQKNPEYPERYRRFVNPDTLKLHRDTLVGWLNSLKLKSDSFLLKDSLRRGKGFPGIKPRKQNQDAMVLNLPPFPDKMPNANVATPGVHYHLKIIGSKREISLNRPEIHPEEQK